MLNVSSLILLKAVWYKIAFNETMEHDLNPVHRAAEYYPQTSKPCKARIPCSSSSLSPRSSASSRSVTINPLNISSVASSDASSKMTGILCCLCRSSPRQFGQVGCPSSTHRFRQVEWYSGAHCACRASVCVGSVANKSRQIAQSVSVVLSEEHRSELASMLMVTVSRNKG